MCDHLFRTRENFGEASGGSEAMILTLLIGIFCEAFLSELHALAVLDWLPQNEFDESTPLETIVTRENEMTWEIRTSTWSGLSGSLFKQFYGKGMEGLCPPHLWRRLQSLMQQRNFIAHGMPVGVESVTDWIGDSAAVKSEESTYYKESAFTVIVEDGVIPEPSPETSPYSVYSARLCSYYLSTAGELCTFMAKLIRDLGYTMPEDIYDAWAQQFHTRTQEYENSTKGTGA